MSFIKKHLCLVLCAVGVLVGAGCLTMGLFMGSANATERAAINRQASAVDRFRRQAVHDDELVHYQSSADRVGANADQIKLQAHQTTDRPLISDEVFPAPAGKPLVSYRPFARRYCRVLEGFLEQLNAKDRPSTEEIKRDRLRTDSVSQDDFRSNLNRSRNQPGSEMKSQEERLDEDFYRRRAQEISVYASVNAFSCYGQWWSADWEGTDSDILFSNGWYTQIAAWIQQDIVATIVQMNQGSASVADSPVKRLIEISFAGRKFGAAAGPGRTSTPRIRSQGRSNNALTRRGSSDTLPGYVTVSASARNAQPANQIVNPWTKRQSGKVYDVVHFEIAVILDSTTINDFLNVLQGEKVTEVKGVNESETIRRNQITVLQYETLQVDHKNEKKDGYYYGNDSLTGLRLVCEYVFFKEGYDHLKPQVVKDAGKAPLGGRAAAGRRSTQRRTGRRGRK